MFANRSIARRMVKAYERFVVKRHKISVDNVHVPLLIIAYQAPVTLQPPLTRVARGDDAKLPGKRRVTPITLQATAESVTITS
jgi:hypothetical protein